MEKFVGDAVMAVFGIPVSHEDDALRAVRAASEMRAAIVGARARGADRRQHGRGRRRRRGRDARHRRCRERRSPPRAGRAAGEVADRRGDAVARARRGRASRPSSPSRSRASPSPSRPSACSRCSATRDALARHLETPLVGRERERQRLWRDYEDAVADRTCQPLHAARPGRHRQVASRGRLPGARRRRGRRPARTLPLVR